jgi:exodeoxyribonuclease VII small subunit
MSDEQPEQLHLLLDAEKAQRTESKTRTEKSTANATSKSARPPAPLLTEKKQAPTTEGPNTMPETTTKPADFETMLSELEKVVAQLEGELKLEEAMALFERGLGLSRDCESFLKTAQHRIEVLKKGPGGAVATVPFEEEAEVAT